MPNFIYCVSVSLERIFDSNRTLAGTSIGSARFFTDIKDAVPICGTKN